MKSGLFLKTKRCRTTLHVPHQSIESFIENKPIQFIGYSKKKLENDFIFQLFHPLKFVYNYVLLLGVLDGFLSCTGMDDEFSFVSSTSKDV